MAAIVSTRILRLQAVSPRTTAVNLQTNINVGNATLIAGTAASTVVANAAAGAAESGAYALALAKLSKAGGDILTGIVDLQVTSNYNAGVRVGNVTWDTATGAVTGGSGIVMTRLGLLGVAAGVTNFAITNAGDVTLIGTVTASAGAIGGFTIGSDYLRDSANSFGLASTVTGGDDVRFWAGDTFANRASAPFRITEAGVITASSGAIGGFTLGADYLRDAGNSFGLASTVTGGDDVRFWAGAAFASRATAPFRLTEAGVLTASSGTFSGSITGASGTFSGNLSTAGYVSATGSTAGAGGGNCTINAAPASSNVDGFNAWVSGTGAGIYAISIGSGPAGQFTAINTFGGTGYALNATGSASAPAVHITAGSGQPALTTTGAAELGLLSVGATMTATTAGVFKANIGSTTYANAGNPQHELVSDNGTYNAVAISSNHASTPYGLWIGYRAATPNNANNHFIYCVDSTAARFEVYSNGGVVNYSANDVNLSDERMKFAIKPAESYWEKWKQIEFSTSFYRDQRDSYRNLGVIAQQVERVAPEFISNDGFGDTPWDGVPFKGIYETDFMYAMGKVAQELQARVEALETRH